MKQFTTIVFTFLIVLMNVGLTFNAHYCGTEIADQSFSIGYDEVSCGMEKLMESCSSNSSSSHIQKKSCCKNTHLQIEVDDDYNSSNHLSSEINLNFVVAFVVTYVQHYFTSNSSKIAYPKYVPPIPDHDVQVMNQTFLI